MCGKTKANGLAIKRMRFYDIGEFQNECFRMGKRTFIVNKTAEGRVNGGATKSVNIKENI